MNLQTFLFRVKRKLFSITARFFYRSIIVRMDGGICSQIAFYALGKHLSETKNGGKRRNVLFDTAWFTENGTDLTGNFSRTFQLLRAFPAMPFKRAEQTRKIAFYKEHFVSNSTDVSSFTPPAYLGLYYRSEPFVFRYREFFRAHFTPDNLVFSNENANVLGTIQSAAHSCCVHVRRGDLSTYLTDYGEPVTIDYFKKAYEFVTEQHPDTRFFVFSDEPKWTRLHVMPIFSQNADTQNTGAENSRAELVDINDADSGYIDLYLMAQCTDCIASQGSFGVYAYVLSAMNGRLVVPKTVTEEKRALYRSFFPAIKEL